MSCHALYLHIPFCERKCPYCDFYSVPARQELLQQYLQKLLLSLRQCPFSLSPLRTVYFGGGTPSLLGGKAIGQLLEGIAQRFGICPDAEITVECNPHSTLPALLADLAAAGVNRISLGMQSADDQRLRQLGRLHTNADTRAAVEAARRHGIAQISLDLMLALPGQTAGQARREAAACAGLDPDHISAYLLKIEPGTPFASQHIETRCPDEDGQADLYLEAVEALEQAGYAQYEISNFARAGRVSRHNLTYWRCEEYLGVGPAAHSFLDGRRRYFPRDLGAFLKAEDPWKLLVDDGPGGGWEEQVMLRLRLAEGLSRKTLEALCPGCDLASLWERAAKLPAGLLQYTPDTIRLTPQGFLVSNAILGELLP